MKKLYIIPANKVYAMSIKSHIMSLSGDNDQKVTVGDNGGSGYSDDQFTDAARNNKNNIWSEEW